MKYLLITRDDICLELDSKQAEKLIDFGKIRYEESIEDKQFPKMTIFNFTGESNLFIYSIVCIEWEE